MPASYLPALRYCILTPLYDPVVALATRERTFKQRLLRQSALLSGMDVLDLGCGTGTLAVWAAKAVAGLRLTGIDADAAVLARARRKSAQAGVWVRFDEGTAAALPYADRQFDRVLSSLFFHHLAPDDKRLALQEAWRVLRPGGELHLADLGRPLGWLSAVLVLPVRLFDGLANTRDHVRGRLPTLVEEAGFVEVSLADELTTPCGTIALLRAVKPREAGPGPGEQHP